LGKPGNDRAKQGAGTQHADALPEPGTGDCRGAIPIKASSFIEWQMEISLGAQTGGSTAGFLPAGF